jgi:hypothetical protein
MDEQKTNGQLVCEIGDRQRDKPPLRTLLGDTLSGGRPAAMVRNVRTVSSAESHSGGP